MRKAHHADYGPVTVYGQAIDNRGTKKALIKTEDEKVFACFADDLTFDEIRIYETYTVITEAVDLATEEKRTNASMHADLVMLLLSIVSDATCVQLAIAIGEMVDDDSPHAKAVHELAASIVSDCEGVTDTQKAELQLQRELEEARGDWLRDWRNDR